MRSFIFKSDHGLTITIKADSIDRAWDILDTKLNQVAVLGFNGIYVGDFRHVGGF